MKKNTKHTKKTKKKLSLAQSKWQKTHDNPFTSKKHTKETKQKMRLKALGRKSPFKNKYHTKESKKKIQKNHADMSGDKNPMFGVHRFGKDSPHWQGGITELHFWIRSLNESKEWKFEIFKRDNYTCQKCNYNGHNIEAHHIKEFAKLLSEFLKEYDQFSPIEDKETLIRLAMKWKPFWDIDNGKTLCKDCHKNIRKVTKE